MVTTIKQPQVNTQRPAKDDPTPRMPHEHDESPDSQQSPPREDMQQAYLDLERGLVDTDRRGIRGVEEVKKPVKKP